MRSRTSQGVSEWSGGEELYIGSAVSAIGRVSGVNGIVPGPPDGSRGSTGWGHPSRRAPWAEVGRKPAHSGLVRPPWAPHAPRVGNPRGGGASTCLGGYSTPLAGAPPLGGLYKRGEGGQPHLKSWRLPLPCYTSPSRRSSSKPCCDHCCIHHHAVVLLDLHQPLLPPCWIKKEETSSAPYVC